MIKFLKDRILPLFMVAWLGGLLPACINDDEDTATGPEKTDGFNISIAISAGEASTARAYEGGLPEEGGIGAENYINIDDLQIYAFSTDGSELLAQVYPQSDGSKVAMEPSVVQIGNMYYLKAELSYDIFSKPENQTFKLVAVANEAQSAVAGWGALTGLTYIRTPMGNTSWYPVWGDSGIPMFGVQEVSLAGYSFKTNNQFNPFTLDNVNMLRAMAKIEVINAVEGTVGAINSVNLTPGYHTQGRIAPNGVDAMTTTEDVMVANIPDDPGLQMAMLSFHKEAAGKFVAYVPEFDLDAGNRGDAINIDIAGTTYHLSLTPYENGLPGTVDEDNAYPWNALLRNHIYRYTITGMKASALLVGLLVKPWDAVPLNPDYE